MIQRGDWFDENLISMVFVDPGLSLQLSGDPGQPLDKIDSLKLGFDYRNAQIQSDTSDGRLPRSLRADLRR